MLFLLGLGCLHVLSRVGEGIHERAYLERTRDGEQYLVMHGHRARVIRHHEPVGEVEPTAVEENGQR